MWEFQGLVYDVLLYGTLALALWAFVDALIRPARRVSSPPAS